MLSFRHPPKVADLPPQIWPRSLQISVDRFLRGTKVIEHSPYWGLGIASLVLTLVNGPLVLSAGIGWVVYQKLVDLSPQQWQQLFSRLQQRWAQSLSSQGKTWLTTGVVLLSTYLVTTIWSETHHLGMALVLGGQSLLILLLLGLTLQREDSHVSNNTKTDPVVDTPEGAAVGPASISSVEALLLQLTDPDPLLRLITVRRLVRIVCQHSSDLVGPVSVRSHLIDCFHLMLAQETEPMVRTAIREGLSHLRQAAPQLPEGAPPLPDAESIRQAPQKIRRPVVEYVEYLDP